MRFSDLVLPADPPSDLALPARLRAATRSARAGRLVERAGAVRVTATVHGARPSWVGQRPAPVSVHTSAAGPAARAQIRDALRQQSRVLPVGTLESITDIGQGDMPPDVGAGTLAYYDPGAQRIDLSITLNAADTQARYLQAETAGWFSHATGTVLARALAHEIGHHVANLIDQAGATTRLWGRVYERAEFAAVDDERNEPGRWVRHRKPQIRRLVSGYAATGPAELLAEVWAEYSTNDEPAEPVLTIGETMRQLAGRRR